MKVTVELKNGEALGPYTNIHHVDLYDRALHIVTYPVLFINVTDDIHLASDTLSPAPVLFINVTDDIHLVLMEEDDNG